MSAKLMHVVGARPNFVKLAPVIAALADEAGLEQLVVHTGQHYDARMSDDILADLQFPTPDVYLGIGSGTHAEQTGRTMIAFERVLLEERPELVVVAGDVNATLACALTASKAHIPVAHVESGLRSWDWTMPEEINRTITDRISALLFTHSPEARDNLVTEGIDEGRVHYVGNTMIDSLRRAEPFARRRAVWRGFGLEPHAYVLVTLHRPSNVDVADQLTGIVSALCELASRAPVVFPLHPRTAALLEATGQLDRLRGAGVWCCEPLGYIDFLSMELGAGSSPHGLGGRPGGVDRPRRPLLHAAPQHRTAGHPDPGHQHAAPRRSPGDPSGGPERRAAGRLHGAALGRARRRADRRPHPEPARPAGGSGGRMVAVMSDRRADVLREAEQLSRLLEAERFRGFDPYDALASPILATAGRHPAGSTRRDPVDEAVASQHPPRRRRARAAAHQSARALRVRIRAAGRPARRRPVPDTGPGAERVPRGERAGSRRRCRMGL